MAANIVTICVEVNLSINPSGNAIKKLDKPIIKQKRTTGGVYQAFRGKVTPQQYTNYPVNLIEFNGVSGTDRQHPTQKPVALLEYLIKTYTNKADKVLDNCMGSGSTGVAAINTGRKFIGIELDKEYFNIAEKRINKVKERLLQNTQQPLF